MYFYYLRKYTISCHNVCWYFNDNTIQSHGQIWKSKEFDFSTCVDSAVPSVCGMTFKEIIFPPQFSCKVQCFLCKTTIGRDQLSFTTSYTVQCLTVETAHCVHASTVKRTIQSKLTHAYRQTRQSTVRGIHRFRSSPQLCQLSLYALCLLHRDWDAHLPLCFSHHRDGFDLREALAELLRLLLLSFQLLLVLLSLALHRFQLPPQFVAFTAAICVLARYTKYCSWGTEQYWDTIMSLRGTEQYCPWEVHKILSVTGTQNTVLVRYRAVFEVQNTAPVGDTI